VNRAYNSCGGIIRHANLNKGWATSTNSRLISAIYARYLHLTGMLHYCES